MKPPDRIEQIAVLPLWAAPLLRVCGIHSVDELAGHTPETLAARLRERILFELTPDRIEAEDWIGQARRLSVADPDGDGGESADPPDDPTEGPDRSGETDAEVVDVTPSETSRQLGGFTVFVDTVSDHDGPDTGQWRVRVYHDESGEEVTLPSIEPGPWAAWILDKVFEEQEPSLYHLVVTIEESTVITPVESDRSVGVTLRVDGLERLERALGGATVGAVLGGSR